MITLFSVANQAPQANQNNEMFIYPPQTFSGNIVPLNLYRISYNTELAQSYTEYHLSVIRVLGAIAKIWINTITEPIIPDATKVGEVNWESGVDFDLLFEVEQGRVVYFYVKR